MRPGLVYLTLWPWLGVGPAQAQAPATTVTGRAIDRETVGPLAGAVVEARGAMPARMETDSAGRFRLVAAVDTIELRVWRFDYAPLDTVIAVAALDDELVLALERRPIRLRGLTVDADRGGAAQERALFEYLTTGSGGELFAVPPVQNVEGGNGVIGAWLRRSRRFSPF